MFEVVDRLDRALAFAFHIFHLSFRFGVVLTPNVFLNEKLKL